jgi:hypothetical protein
LILTLFKARVIVLTIKIKIKFISEIAGVDAQYPIQSWIRGFHSTDHEAYIF